MLPVSKAQARTWTLSSRTTKISSISNGLLIRQTGYRMQRELFRSLASNWVYARDSQTKSHSRSLVEQAAEMGYPWLLSFSGMADVLKWPKRPPLVPEGRRDDILKTWAPHCQGLIPRQHSLPFEKIRAFTPEQFVELLLHMQVENLALMRISFQTRF